MESLGALASSLLLPPPPPSHFPHTCFPSPFSPYTTTSKPLSLSPSPPSSHVSSLFPPQKWHPNAAQPSRPLEPTFADHDVLQAAWEILDNFNRNDILGAGQPSLQSSEGSTALAASVLVACEAALVQEGCRPLLGICANHAEEAVAVLREWTTALGCEFVMPQILDAEQNSNSIPGPVYMKFNPHSKMCYLKAYYGNFRGVIIQIGEKQVGHLPLFLFSQNIIGKAKRMSIWRMKSSIKYGKISTILIV